MAKMTKQAALNIAWDLNQVMPDNTFRPDKKDQWWDDCKAIAATVSRMCGLGKNGSRIITQEQFTDLCLDSSKIDVSKL